MGVKRSKGTDRGAGYPHDDAEAAVGCPPGTRRQETAVSVCMFLSLGEGGCCLLVGCREQNFILACGIYERPQLTVCRPWPP